MTTIEELDHDATGNSSRSIYCMRFEDFYVKNKALTCPNHRVFKVLCKMSCHVCLTFYSKNVLILNDQDLLKKIETVVRCVSPNEKTIRSSRFLA